MKTFVVADDQFTAHRVAKDKGLRDWEFIDSQGDGARLREFDEARFLTASRNMSIQVIREMQDMAARQRGGLSYEQYQEGGAEDEGQD